MPTLCEFLIPTVFVTAFTIRYYTTKYHVRQESIQTNRGYSLCAAIVYYDNENFCFNECEFTKTYCNFAPVGVKC